MRTQPTGPTLKLWRFFLAGLVYAALTALAFPPSGLWPIALLAPLLLVWAGCRAKGRPIRAGLLTGLGTLPMWVMGHMYLIRVTVEGFPGLCLYLAVYPALCVALIDLLLRWAPRTSAAVVAPLVWGGLELLRGEVVLTGYPWYLAGQPLIDVPVLAAPASIGSVYIVSFLVVGLCSAAADAAGWSGRQRSKGGLAAGVWASLWLGLSLVGILWPAPATQSVRVAAVQTNVPQDNKIGWDIHNQVSDFKRFVELTRRAAVASPPPDVILWPETMFPGLALNSDGVEEINRRIGPYQLKTPVQLTETQAVSFLDRDYFYKEILNLHHDLATPMVVGAIARDPEQLDHPFNSAFLLQNGGVDPIRYDKMDLTPFGEVIPYIWRWPELQQKVLSLGAASMAFELQSGDRPQVLQLRITRSPGGESVVRLAAPICFEGTKPATCRRLAMFAQGGPAAGFVNLSNDGWFSSFSGREMHLLCARWRCVELGLPMVRAVNTGLSAAIDPRGRLMVLGPSQVERADRVDGVLLADVPMVMAGSNTIFSRAGFLPVLALLGLLVVMIPVSQWLGRRKDAGTARVI